jgi:hypothetical protein
MCGFVGCQKFTHLIAMQIIGKILLCLNVNNLKCESRLAENLVAAWTFGSQQQSRELNHAAKVLLSRESRN